MPKKAKKKKQAKPDKAALKRDRLFRLMLSTISEGIAAIMWYMGKQYKDESLKYTITDHVITHRFPVHENMIIGAIKNWAEQYIPVTGWSESINAETGAQKVIVTIGGFVDDELEFSPTFKFSPIFKFSFVSAESVFDAYVKAFWGLFEMIDFGSDDLTLEQKVFMNQLNKADEPYIPRREIERQTAMGLRDLGLCIRPKEGPSGSFKIKSAYSWRVVQETK